MRAQEVLAQQFGMVYAVAAKNLEGMTHADSLVSVGGGNCANWILGHLVNVHNGVMAVVGAEPVWEDEQLKAAGWDPIDDPSRAIDWDTLRDRFLASRDRCLAALGGLSETALDEPVPDPFGGTTTRGALLAVLSAHQWYHVGQLGLARRAAGREGAILGPGQPPRA
jgi:uncharacterized damage-inducible protein DinB